MAVVGVAERETGRQTRVSVGVRVRRVTYGLRTRIAIGRVENRDRRAAESALRRVIRCRIRRSCRREVGVA